MSVLNTKYVHKRGKDQILVPLGYHIGNAALRDGLIEEFVQLWSFLLDEGFIGGGQVG